MPFDCALIDADVLLYSVCRGNERDADFGHMHVLYSDYDECVDIIKDRVEELRRVVGATRVILFLSDSANWRKDVMPSYKSHRKDVRKPLAFGRLKDHLRCNYPTQMAARLEADDLLGIWSREDNCIVSLDKDFFGVAGNFGRIGVDGGVSMHMITDDQARYYHFLQAFMGDRTDGYPGCPGVGVKTAEKKINTVTSKPGEVRLDEQLAVWSMIINEYGRQYQDPSVAHENFMVSKILDGKTGVYDFETRQVSITLPHGVTFNV